MKRFLLSVLFVGCLCSAYAQSKSKSISLKWTPQNMFNRSFGRFPIGVEYHVKDWSVEYEHGFGMRPIELIANSSPEKTGFHSRLGMRYNDFNWLREGMYDFFGVYVTHRSQAFTKQSSWYQSNNGKYLYDISNIDIKDWLVHGFYGLRLRIAQPIWVESIVGLGARRRNVLHDTQGERLAIDEHLWDEWFTPIERNEGIRYRPSILLNFKLVWEFSQTERE